MGREGEKEEKRKEMRSGSTVSVQKHTSQPQGSKSYFYSGTKLRVTMA